MNEKLEYILQGLPFTVTDEQKDFLVDFINSEGRNFFLLGDQGVGKSTIMEILSRYYKNEIVFLGSTGLASAEMPNNIGSGTAHRMLSLSREVSTSVDIRNVRPPCNDLLGKSDLIKIIVIDEAFSLDSDHLYTIIQRKKRFDKKSQKRESRNIRFLFVGDVCQRPPIVSEGRGEELTARYGHYLMFRTSLWDDMNFKGHVLVNNQRQNTATKEDRIFLEALKVIRYGQESRYPALLSWLNKRVKRNYSKTGMYLAPTNSMVGEYNDQYLQRNPNDKYVYTAEIQGQYNMKDCPADEEITLAKGATIISLINEENGAYVNGDAFVVHDLSSEGITAKLLRTGEIHFLPIHEFKAEEAYIETGVIGEDGIVSDVLRKRTIGCAYQLGVKLAAAFSISRCQGKTFDKEGVIDVGSDWLYTKKGMEDFMVAGLFVALSRFRSINQITLARPLKAIHIKTCKESVNFWFETLENMRNENSRT